jgi:hypothetical protein
VKQTGARFRLRATLSATKRRRRCVEFLVGSTPESNGFVLFRKRNPLVFRQGAGELTTRTDDLNPPPDSDST